MNPSRNALRHAFDAAFVADLERRQTSWTAAWHLSPPPGEDEPGPLMALVREQHRRNFDLWHEEDLARAPGAGDAVIAAVKRRIDRLNQERNDLVEKIDVAIFDDLRPPSDVPAGACFNTETPGMIIDRLSILALKIFHMREQEERVGAPPAHAENCRQRRSVLERQRADLVSTFEVLATDLRAGRSIMRMYRQFKMYNDPQLNPAIYGSTVEAGRNGSREPIPAALER
jgi:Protein of unknown function (DUF4254)